MFELLYPINRSVQIFPIPTAESPSTEVKGEFFPVVEPSGLVIGKALREYCHSGAKLLHPVVHIHIIDRMGNIYLQKRSMNKDIQPGKWDTAVGGHVDYGESITEALYREAQEELGLCDFHPIHLCTYEFESSVEKELVSVFAVIGTYNLKPDPSEIEEGRWWPLKEIDEAIGKEILTPNFESEFATIRKQLLSLL